MKAIILLFVIAAVLTSCKNQEKESSSESQPKEQTEHHDTHSSKESIDWEGSYFGVLPCASCPGINVLITLNPDETFEKTTEYQESDYSPETMKGKIIWSDDNSNITIGEGVYKVGEGALFRLDADKKVVTGELSEDYILKKTELQDALDINEGYTLQTFTGSDEKKYNVIFNTNTKTPTALITSEDINETLFQTKAWAKGAEYNGGNVQLSVKGSEGTLYIGDNKIILTED